MRAGAALRDAAELQALKRPVRVAAPLRPRLPREVEGPLRSLACASRAAGSRSRSVLCGPTLGARGRRVRLAAARLSNHPLHVSNAALSAAHFDVSLLGCPPTQLAVHARHRKYAAIGLRHALMRVRSYSSQSW